MLKGRSKENVRKAEGKTEALAFQIEDSIDRCLRIVMKQADRLDKEMDTARKQKSLQSKGYITSPKKERKKESIRWEEETSDSSKVSDEMSSGVIYGCYKKTKNSSSSSQNNPKFCYFGVPKSAQRNGEKPKVIYPKGFKPPRKFVRPPLPKVLSASPAKKKESTILNTYSVENVSSLQTSETTQSIKKTSKSFPPQKHEFPVSIVENNISQTCMAKMTVSRRQDSDWLLIDVEIFDTNGKTLLSLRTELLGFSTRNVVTNGK